VGLSRENININVLMFIAKNIAGWALLLLHAAGTRLNTFKEAK
jgi:hypothetical protein